jgi:sodium transport system permease protein
MSWKNVGLILKRELRDQLRDRRTLFMIAVLPILLYPLLGMTYFQISQFLREKPTKVFVVGAADLPEKPALFENRQFAPSLFFKPGDARLLELTFYGVSSDPWGEPSDKSLEIAREKVETGQFDAALVFPNDFTQKLGAFREEAQSQAIEARKGKQNDPKKPNVLPEMPNPEIIYTTANEKSQITYVRLRSVLQRYNGLLGQQNLEAAGLARIAASPLDISKNDLAEKTGTRGIAIWAKLLPMMLLLWALTGAFYPAIDLCAGEKERGTLETLLCSPAMRSEIVMGKLLTVMIFSMVTVLLNIGSIGLTGSLLMKHMPGIGAIPYTAIGWLLLALFPVAALFGALCLALAAFAKSSKEGQYYLMPLLLITMPLTILPMIPSVELNLGISLIPVTNICLWLRCAIQGQYDLVLKYAAPVIGITALCCLASIRWAVDQFNSESILLSQAERSDPSLWLRHLIRDRQPTPTVALAFFTGVLILVMKFFLGLTMPIPDGFGGLLQTVLVTQLVVIVIPALFLTTTLTTRPAKTLLLDRPAWRIATKTVPMAFLLALLLHPFVIFLQGVLTRLYPLGPEAEAIQSLLATVPSFWWLFLLAAVIPAVCEELAFRGFLLSGFRHTGHRWRAIALSAVFFGLTHSIIQQSIMTCMIGIILGYLAIQSGSLLTVIAYHMTHNGLALATTLMTPELLERWPIMKLLVRSTGQELTYQTPAVVIGLILGIVVLGWFHNLKPGQTDEERLQEAIRLGIEANDEPLGIE